MNDVHVALAEYLRIPVELILDAQLLREDLGLGAMDLVTIVLGLEDDEPYHGEFPVGELERVRTVADLVAIHRDWSDRDTLEQITRVSLTDVVIVDDRSSVE